MSPAESRRLTSASDVSELSLLTYLLDSGSERIGALDFQASSSEYVSRPSTSATLEQLMAAATDIETGRMLPPPLAEALTRGTSIGGARPKVLLEDAGRSLIAKFSSTTDIRPVVKAEGVAIELARHVGLNVAPTQVIHTGAHDPRPRRVHWRPLRQLRAPRRSHPPGVHPPRRHTSRTVLPHRIQHPGRQYRRSST
jgi:HipA-like C-terminal domain